MTQTPAAWLHHLAPNHALIQRASGTVSAAQLSHHASAVTAALADSPAGPVLLFCEDAGYFLTGLLGILAAGREALLPGHAASDYIREILPSGATVLTDLPGLPGAAHIPTLAAATSPLPPGPETPPQLGFFTSGSTGQPKLCHKTLHQLCAEVLAHRESGPLSGRTGLTTLGTVSHQHIYGLLFRILFPLASGGTIHARRLDHWESIIPLLTPNTLLVSSPAHLTRLLPDMPPAPTPAHIVSSGGPLPFTAARDTARIFGRTPLEILGSTETGGIAWRTQTTPNADWTPLPGVTIRIAPGDHLELHSPFTGLDDFTATGDQASERPGGRFQLGPRHDRIVKIEGKRISLPRVEDALRALPEVEDAAVFALDGILAAAAVLSPQGQALLDSTNQFRTRTHLRAALTRLELAERPKRWRFVAALPTNAEGKRTQHALQALFAPPELPTILSQTVTPTQARFELELPETLRWFEGHFPGQALLPGVAQLHIATACARLAWGHPFTGRQMSRVKFRRVLYPNQKVSLLLTLRNEELDFQYLHDGEIAASGTFKS